MQSILDAGPPLSPFTFDAQSNHPMMDTSSMQDDGVDLFRYYMDLQAYQGKELQQPDPSSSILYNGAMTDGSASINSPYNAFFNPALYTNTLSSIAPSSIAPTPSTSTATGQPIPSISQQSETHHQSSVFPFAEAASSTTTSYNTINPSTLSNAPSYPSFDHLAGSENPQPIDPHLLMTSSDLPTVKQEDIDAASTPFHFNHPSLPLSASTLPPLSHVATTSSTANPSTRRSASAHIDDSMNGIDGLSDESGSEDEASDDDDDEVPAPQKRSSAATTTTTNNKKRTTARKSSSSNSKRTSAASAQSKKESSILHSQQAHPHALVPVPEWEDRLSKAEYDKLSSKEKRQMRNKISARNFRHRRKAHIDTLEALVADKESVIAVLSEEVGTLRTENKGLRADIELLKKNWESIAAKIGASTSQQTPTQHHHHHLTPDEDDLYGAPGSLPALSPAASSSAESTNGDHLSELSFEQARGMADSQAQTQASQARPSSSTSTSTSPKRVTRSAIQRPNLRKDLGPSGASFSAFGMGNRSMNVHTTLIPELNFNFPIPPPSVFANSPPTSTCTLPALTDAASASSGRTSPTIPSSLNNSSSTGSIADMLAGKRERDANANTRLNMNPALNGLSQEQINNLREQFFNANSGMITSPPQLSEDIAANASGKISRHPTNLDPLQNSFFDTNPFISLRQDSLQDYRAQLYAKLANNVAGIHQAQQSQSTQSSNKGNQQQGMNGLRPAFFANQPVQQSKELQNAEEMAKIASIAQKTLFDKLSTAFWDAFAGNNTGPVKSIVPIDAATRKNSHRKSNSDNGQQVVDLLAGRSRLQIVKNEKEQDVEALVKQIDSMGLKK